MPLVDSKGWRVRTSNNVPAIDAEIASLDRKNVGMICKVLTYSAPNGLEGHTMRYFTGDTIPNATDYPDTVAPIGSCFCRLVVSGTGVVTGKDMYVKSAASTWVLYSPAATVAAALTGPTNILSTSRLVLADVSGGTFTVTLPLAANSIGADIVFKNVGTGVNALIIDGNGSELIDGAVNVFSMDAQFDTLTLACDGVGWHIIASILA